MSETKHTPLPWHIDRRSMSICSEQNELVTGIGADSFDEWDANAQLIATSVNARPKVEELVDRILRNVNNSPSLWFEQLVAKAREVETALRGEKA